MAILYQHKIRERLHLIEKRTKRPFISWTEELNDVDPVYFFSLGPICSFRERFFWGTAPMRPFMLDLVARM
ncbi:hypothetical protein BV455_02460 [Parageobacillus caldoxylosilyticus]|nr:hypothetical protein BV455_02460 [Parageobacillus caldoxylosilyticus]